MPLMRFQLAVLFGLACAYGGGAYYTSHQPAELIVAAATFEAADLRDGDILFQTSSSDASRAIQLATHGTYSHCGIVFYENGKPFVYEAVQPVTKAPLSNWTAGRYVAKRLKNAQKVLTADVLAKMKSEANKHYGKNYDPYFNWSDDEIYCSELVYKVYERGAGVKVGELKKLKDYNLSHELVKSQLQVRYGNNLPLEEIMISPGAIFESDLLTTVAAK